MASGYLMPPRMPDGDVPGLIAALFAGLSDRPLWGGFLDLLRHETMADYATLSFLTPGRYLEKSIYILSSQQGTSQCEHANPDYFYALDRGDPNSRPTLEEGRPYSFKQQFGSNGDPRAEFYRKMVDRQGIPAILQMRVRERNGVDAWLTIARNGPEFSPDDVGILTAIAPVLRGVLQIHTTTERDLFAASLNADAVRQLHFGWLILDRDGIVLECNEHGQSVLTGSGILSKRPNGRLAAVPPELERQIFDALGHICNNADARPRAIILSRDPWLDMLLVPARGKAISTNEQRAAIAYVHGDSWRSTDRQGHLAELFGLSPREARLALAVSRGMTLAEAAAEFGLTVGTVRSYSKSIYAKTGARGLPDLVRIVMGSVLSITPE
jgi:DNA-binding CsgD family transcriptional regulator